MTDNKQTTFECPECPAVFPSALVLHSHVTHAHGDTTPSGAGEDEAKTSCSPRKEAPKGHTNAAFAPKTGVKAPAVSLSPPAGVKKTNRSKNPRQQKKKLEKKKWRAKSKAKAPSRAACRPKNSTGGSKAKKERVPATVSFGAIIVVHHNGSGVIALDSGGSMWFPAGKVYADCAKGDRVRLRYLPGRPSPFVIGVYKVHHHKKAKVVPAGTTGKVDVVTSADALAPLAVVNTVVATVSTDASFEQNERRLLMLVLFAAVLVKVLLSTLLG